MVNTAIIEWIASDDPADFPPDAPVVLLLHGYGSHEHDLPPIVEWLGVTGPWVSLRAPMVLPQGGFAWAPITIPGDPGVDDVRTATATLWAWIDEHLGGSPIVAIGFSQGGLMVSQLFRTRPERIRAAAILSGFVASAPQVADKRIAASRPAVFWSHGTADAVISEDAVNRTRRFLDAHTTVLDREYEGLGHSIDERVLSDLREYLTNSGLDA